MVTPVRRQYLDLKARYPDAILLFRLGDFYETFDEDAKLVAAELDIALTSKPMGGGLRSPLAGVPVRSVEQHLAKLVARGHRVAICEQLESPRASKGLVKRGVVRVVSPGTALEPSLLEAGQASACAALRLVRQRRELYLGIATADVTTGAVHLSEIRKPADAVDELWRRGLDQLAQLGVREALWPDDEPVALDAGALDEGTPVEGARNDGALNDGALNDGALNDGALGELTLTRRPSHEFRRERAERALLRQYGAPAAAFGLDQHPAALEAAGALLEYLWTALPEPESDTSEDTRKDDATVPENDWADQTERVDAGAGTLRQLSPPRWFQAEAYLQWDAATQRALAIAERGPEQTDGSGPRTLLAVLDRCGSALGRRWLRSALTAPLLDLERAERRLDRVAALVRRPALRRALAQRLRGSPDLERQFARAASGLALPSELAALARGLSAAAALARLIEDATADEPDCALVGLAERLGPAPEAAGRLADALSEQPPSEYGRGVLRPGADAESDRWRAALEQLRGRLLALESDLREETGIGSLRVGYHRTFGYHIELTRSQSNRAPESWERRQSLRDRERYSESRLRELERELTEAEAGLAEAERACVEQLRRALIEEAEIVRRTAGAVARLDAACSQATVAAERAWTRPTLEYSGELEIIGGRHPIVEATASAGAFVPNDLQLADDGLRAPQLLLVTGPNMAGKSTYLRQTALIVILAQAGSFVPAERARIGLVDRIFARVGAHDDLAAGRSTFMVEMLETARLLHGATDRSLILLDEIGRGTSTWDGLAIAQSVAESLAGGPLADHTDHAGHVGSASATGTVDAAGPSSRPQRPQRPQRGPRTLFATHFHELTALAGQLPRVANAAVQVAESDSGMIEFLYRIAPGAADRSYGVQVAAQAGLPAGVVERARLLLQWLEQGGPTTGPTEAREPQHGSAGPESLPTGTNIGAVQSVTPQAGAPQLMLMPPPAHPILHDLADLDIDGITPLEAISALYALRDQAHSELRGLHDLHDLHGNLSHAAHGAAHGSGGVVEAGG